MKRVKEKAFSKGRPIIFGEGGKVYAEWPDGRIEELKRKEKNVFCDLFVQTTTA